MKSTIILLLLISVMPLHVHADHLHYLVDEFWKIAQELRKQNKYALAAEMYKKSAEAESESSNPRKDVLSVQFSMVGKMNYYIGHYNEALDYFMQALEIYRELGDKSGIAVNLNNIGSVYKAWGRYKEALDYYMQALEIGREIGDKSEIATRLNNIGSVYNSLGRYKEALDYYTQALEIQRELGDKSGIAISLNNIGSLYKSWDRYTEALDYFMQALEIGRELGDKSRIAIYLNNIGSVYYSWGRYKETLNYIMQALEIGRELGDKSGIASRLNNIGQVYQAWGRYKEALDYYMQALEIGRELGDKSGIAIYLNNIGRVYYSWGRYKEALNYFMQALEIGRELGDKSGIASRLNNIGSMYHSWGRYKEALDYFMQALEIDRELGDKSGIATRLNNIGSMYHSWGRYKEALDYYTQALEIDRGIGAKRGISTSLNNIGRVYYSWGRYKEALDYFMQALKINRELGDKSGIATRLNNIGTVYCSWSRYKEALDYYVQALEIQRELGDKSGIAIDLNNIGSLYYSWGRYNEALDYYMQALEINRELEKKDEIATNLNNIGTVYWKLEDYRKASEYFNNSITLIEELRLTATGEIRRDYLASQISTYLWLISTYIRDNKPEEAFNTVELSRAKYLVEQMGENFDKNISFSGIKKYQKNLDTTTAIIGYANINTIMGPSQIVVTKHDIFAIEENDSTFIKNVKGKCKDNMSSSLKNLRGIKIKAEKKDMIEEKERSYEFDTIINYYRILLSKPDLTINEKENLEFISRELYTFLFGDIENKINDRKNLIIIPDGILGYLPFETLIMPDGRYLVEEYTIKYTQSLTVSEIIAGRQYTEKRRPLIAFGGAVYEETTYLADMVSSESELEYIKKNTFIAMNRGESTREAYSSLGLGSWDNIPGSLAEVNGIREIEKNAEIVTGEDVSEETIKAMSQKGDLKNYSVIHLATHGLVVPEFPELSAVVLSLSEDEKENEDGYLRMNEIAGLDIQADFINLSACDTGLGKIYGGEGVVGLTQSFLIAGANGLSVSLWRVEDESTMKFMIGMYKLVKEKGISYDIAITEMKRKFIRGEIGNGKYKNPFYWAPFVYYGGN